MGIYLFYIFYFIILINFIYHFIIYIVSIWFSFMWINLAFLKWGHSGSQRIWETYIIFNCYMQDLGPLNSQWLNSFFFIKSLAGLCYPSLLPKAVTADLYKFIFILKVMELWRCLVVFELAEELFYFIHSSIQKVFYFVFHYFIWPHQQVCWTDCGIFTRNNDLREGGLFPKAGLWMLVLAPFLWFIKRVFIKPLYLYLPRILVGERG